MTDLDLSRDSYAAVSARRTQFDQLVSQVPVLSLTAQPHCAAFLFSIASSPDATTTARVMACLLSFFASITG